MGPSWDGVAGPAATAGVVVAVAVVVAEVVSVELLDVGELLELVDDSADVVEDSDEVVDDEGDVVRVLLDDVVLSSEDSFSDQSSSLSPLSPLPLSSPNRRRRKSVNGLLAGTEDSEAIGAATEPGTADELVSEASGHPT